MNPTIHSNGQLVNGLVVNVINRRIHVSRFSNMCQQEIVKAMQEKVNVQQL